MDAQDAQFSECVAECDALRQELGDSERERLKVEADLVAMRYSLNVMTAARDQLGRELAAMEAKVRNWEASHTANMTVLETAGPVHDGECGNGCGCGRPEAVCLQEELDEVLAYVKIRDARIDRMRDQQDAILVLHEEYEGACTECVELCSCLDSDDDAKCADCTHGNVTWPCRTVQLFDEKVTEFPDVEARIKMLLTQLGTASKFRQLVSDLDRCPHGRHEGDSCAGWRGPGFWDGGCKGGRSLGNPVNPACSVLGVDYRGRFIEVPEERADRVDPANWVHEPEPGWMLHDMMHGVEPHEGWDGYGRRTCG